MSLDWAQPIGKPRGKSPNFPNYQDTRAPDYKPADQRVKLSDHPEYDFIMHLSNGVQFTLNSACRQLRQAKRFAEEIDPELADDLQGFHDQIVESWDYLLEIQESHFKPFFAALQGPSKPGRPKKVAETPAPTKKKKRKKSS